MSEKIKLVTGDTRPFIRLTLTDKTGGVINLSDSNTAVRVHFRAVGATQILSSILCAKPTGGADGVVTFNFPQGTLNVEPGLYEGEIEIDFGGEKQTVYQPLKFVLREQFA
jgi:hypothetical protein